MVNHIVYSEKYSTSIKATEWIATHELLSKKDLRVLLCLFTRLDSTHYYKIDTSTIADTLNISKKDVKESIESLIASDIICKGSDRMSEGYRFTYIENSEDDDN